MIDLRGELAPAERIVLAVDTSERARAEQLAGVARTAGASLIKEGLELSAALGGWEPCAEIAGNADLDWVCDAKLDDIPNTVAKTVERIVGLAHPPTAITIHANSGVEAMRAAQEIAAESGIAMLAVTELTSKKEAQIRKTLTPLLLDLGIDMSQLPDEETDYVRKLVVAGDALDADEAGVYGLVASAKELLDPLAQYPQLTARIKMIPGTRSPGADSHDQQNVDTPENAIANGATLLVIGRQVTNSEDPETAFNKVKVQIERGLSK